MEIEKLKDDKEKKPETAAFASQNQVHNVPSPKS